MSIEQQISEIGRAEVIVVLDQQAQANGAAQAHQLVKHFVSAAGGAHEQALNGLKSDNFTVFAPNRSTRLSDVLPAAKIYPNLGIVLGSVDQRGLTALRSDNSVKAVLPAPVFSLIQPVLSVEVAAPQELTWGLKALGIPAI